MAFTFQELRKLKNDIATAAGISTAAAARVIGFYNGGGPSLRPDIVAAMIAGDFSHVGPALSALGISGNDHGTTQGPAAAAPANDRTTQAPVKDSEPGKAPAMAPDGLQNAPQRKESKQAAKRPTKQKKSNTSPQALPDILEHVKGDILTDDNALPASIPYDIENTMQEFAQHYNIDLEKCSGLQWRAVCLNIGDMLKASGVLIDRAKQRMQGGKPYNPHRVAALLDIWERYTALYKHVPLASDFIAFTGVSREWFYDSQGQGLTSAQLDIAKKARAIEEAALSSAIVDPRENPTGRIYYTKARLGWRETAAADAAPAVVVVSLGELPKLDKIGV